MIYLFTNMARLLSSTCQSDIRKTTQTHIPSFTRNHLAEYPGACTCTGYLKGQASDPTDEVQTRFSQPINFQGG